MFTVHCVESEHRESDDDDNNDNIVILYFTLHTCMKIYKYCDIY